MIIRNFWGALFSGLAIFYHTSAVNPALQSNHNNAMITSRDKSMRPCNSSAPCDCPGGFFLHIDDVPDPKGKCISCTSFKTLRFPDGFILGDDTKLPVAVTIDWKYDSLSCDSSRITILTIARR